MPALKSRVIVGLIVHKLPKDGNIFLDSLAKEAEGNSSSEMVLLIENVKAKQTFSSCRLTTLYEYLNILDSTYNSFSS